MFRNYLKIALRQFRKHIGFSFINVVGLSIGIACSVLVALYVLDKLSFDRFHEKADRIYRVPQTIQIDNRQDTAYPTPPILDPTLVQDLPTVETATRVRKIGSVLVRNEDRVIEEPNVYASDSEFFNVFSFDLPKIKKNIDFQALFQQKSIRMEFIPPTTPITRTARNSQDWHRPLSAFEK